MRTLRLDQLAETGIRRKLAPPNPPPFAPVVGKLMTVLTDPDVKFNEVAKLIGTDAALSSQVLSLANSALFSLRSEIRTILHAIVMVGLPSVKSIIYTSSLWKAAHVSQDPLVRMCWRHNLACALLTEKICVQRGVCDYGYTAGLLHGVGQLALVGRYPDQYARLLDFAVRRGARLRECEQAVFGTDHCELAGKILDSWRLPPELVEGARCHEQPERSSYRIAEYTHSSCMLANRLGFLLQAPGCDLVPDHQVELPATAAQIASDPLAVEEIAFKINAIEASLAFC